MLEDLLVHEVEVYSRSGRVDRFGQAVDVNPRQNTAGENLAGSWPCRAWMRSGGLTSMERSVDVFEKIYTVYTGLDADISEDQAIRVVDPSSGAVIFPLAKIKDSEIKYDSQGPHHQEFTAWIQTGPS